MRIGPLAATAVRPGRPALAMPLVAVVVRAVALIAIAASATPVVAAPPRAALETIRMRAVAAPTAAVRRWREGHETI